MLSRALGLAAEELRARGLGMPEHLEFHVAWPAALALGRSAVHHCSGWQSLPPKIVPLLPPRMQSVRARRCRKQSHRSRWKADNTPREHKNAGLLLFSGWLVATGRFASCSNSFFEVGHTHNVVDQRFSSITRLLRRCQSLQTPGAFADEVQRQLQPTCNREVVVEQLPGAHAWHEFFDHLGVGVSGLTSTALQPHANRCLRLVRRGDLHVFRKSSEADWEVEVPEASRCRSSAQSHR